MDRNSIIGLILIFLVLVVFSVINKPSKEQIEAQRRRQDSIQQVELERARLLQTEQNKIADALPDSTSQAQADSQLAGQLGAFGVAAKGEETFYTLENNLVKLTLSNKGGRIYSVELKEYKTWDGRPVLLFDGPDSQFGLNFFAQNRNIQTDHLFFTTQSPRSVTVKGGEVEKSDFGKEKYNEENPGGTETMTFRLEVSQGSFMEYSYTLNHNSYMAGFNVKMNGLNTLIASNQPDITLVWNFDVPRQEKKSQFGEDRYTQINYKFYEDDVDKLSAGKPESKNLTRTKWIGMKQLFFTSTIVAEEYFPAAQVKSDVYKDNDHYLANFYAGVSLPWSGKTVENYNMRLYFGPNHYKTLRQYKIDLESQVYLGYAIVRPVNRYLIIPVFDFLNRYISNYGIIILLLTIFIKLILFPFTYKSYVSQAKMRLLKPEIDELNEKYGPDKAMEKQQATMSLYKKAGINPMGGCLPMLLQMPVLFAMFFFFPGAIELRQQGFLWVKDLSTYDSILNLPFNIPFYGDHVSLFCLLMTITTIISQKISTQGQANTAMPGMKTMMYMMPIMFLFILNSYSSGLSYYYFLANVITILQTFVVRRLVDEDKIRVQIMQNKKKPVQKSNFQKRMEQMARERGIQAAPPKKKK
ncbi:MAG: membrane protein insertase YidC [Prolixibacteraceae bacterium]|nr:membrane protein insertase YidC [Prolixibacteraceae bacterium]